MTNTNNEKKPLFSPDEPIATSKKDVFNHTYFVDVLLYIITNCTTPINIALYGKWGVGKSTILNFLDEKIEQTTEYKEKFKFVTIDVWKLSPQLLKQEFLEELNRKLESITEKEIESELWHFTEEDTSPIPKFDYKSKEFWKWIAFGIIVFAIILTIGLLINSATEDYDILTPSIMVSIAVPILLAMITTFREISRNAAKSGKKIIPRIESSHKFHVLFQKIIKKYENQNLVVAIDNLDRCDDESVVHILSMIKTFLNEPKCIFIVSCDQDAIVEHLVKKKGQFYEERNAIEFLTKFFQLTLHIPPQINEQLHSYAQEQLEAFSSEINFHPDIVDVLVAGITKNPRKIKQFVYNFVIAFKLADIKENKGILTDKIITTNAPFLAKIVVLREEWPDFFRKLEKNSSLLELLENFIDNDESIAIQKPLLQEILEKNQGLEHFLKSTSLIKSVQVLPFIQLNQESFESSISESETLILKVNQNDHDYVIEILSSVSEDQQHNYVLEITKLCEQYIKDKRIQVAYNSIDILLKTHHIVSKKSQEKIVKFLSKYMPRKEILDYVYRFDVNLLFPLVLLMNDQPKETLLKQYAHSINAYNNMSTTLIKKFITHIDQIPLSISKDVDHNLHMLGQQNTEIFLDCLDILKINEKAVRKFVQGKSIDALMDRIQITKKDRVRDLYLELKYVANEENQSNFVRRIIRPIAQDKSNPMAPSAVSLFQILKEFTRFDFSRLVSEELYLCIMHLVAQYTDVAQKNIVFEILLKIYPNLSKELQEEFVTKLFVPHVTQQPPQNLSTILEIARKEEVEILEHDVVIDNIFSLFQKTPLSEYSINFVILCTPKEKWDKVGEKLVQLIKSMDLGKLQVFSASYSKNFSKIPKKIRTAIIEQAISTSRQFNADQNQPVYTTMSASLEGVSKDTVNSFIDIFLNLVKSNDPRQMQFGINYLQNSFVYTSPDTKKQILEVVFSQFKNSISPNQNFGAAPLNFLVNFNNEMDSEHKEIFSDLIIDVLDKGIAIHIIPHILSSFEKIKFGNKKKIVNEILEKLRQSSNNDIKNKVKQILEK